MMKVTCASKSGRDRSGLPGFVVGLWLSVAWLSQSGVAESPLNVLLITSDDLGIQLNCYGDKTVPTPHLDALASRSVRFQTAYVAQASCSSSRSAMLTGLYPHSNGQYGLANAGVGFRAKQEIIEQSIPNRLKQAGYRTGVIGKLHVNPESEFAFDEHQKQGFGTREIRKQIAFAESFWRIDRDQPWFLMFNVFDPHVNGRAAEGQPAFPDVVDGIPESPIGPEDVDAWPWQGVDTPVMRKRIAGYYNCVQRVDAAVGLLVRSLEETGQRDRTLVIFLGDHGPPFSRGKTTCYEAGLRVPFLVDWPLVTEPHVSEKLVSAVDIAPTVFDAVGLSIPENVQGKSIRPIARADNSIRPGDTSIWRTSLVGEFHFHGASSFHPTRAITDGRYKLIHRLGDSVGRPIVRVDGDPSSRESAKLPEDHPAHALYARLSDPPQWEFYDLQSDPHEGMNLSGDPSVVAEESRLKSALQDWQARTDDPFRDQAFRRRVARQYVPAETDK